jgi:HK97 family phage prohead protease
MATKTRANSREFPRTFKFNARADESGDDLSISGTAIVFGQETVIGGMFREKIAPGAVKKTLRESDQVMLWNHDTGKPLGRKSRGTLRLSETRDGLEVSADLPDNTFGRDAHEAIKRGDVEGMSFGFQIVKERKISGEPDDKLPLFEIQELRLHEVSPVTFPAYETTEVEARESFEYRSALLDGTSDRSDEPHSSTEPGESDPEAANEIEERESLERENTEVDDTSDLEERDHSVVEEPISPDLEADDQPSVDALRAKIQLLKLKQNKEI